MKKIIIPKIKDIDLLTNHKYYLITRRLKEFICDETIMKKITTKRTLKIYWGTAPTGRIHIGYFVPLLKLQIF